MHSQGLDRASSKGMETFLNITATGEFTHFSRISLELFVILLWYMTHTVLYVMKFYNSYLYGFAVKSSLF